jgi:hypothetical protein
MARMAYLLALLYHFQDAKIQGEHDDEKMAAEENIGTRRRHNGSTMLLCVRLRALH